MRKHRHPNPLIDARRPRQRERVGVNPPGFIWNPVEGAEEYRVQVARDRKFEDDSCLELSPAGNRTIVLPDERMEAGKWFWRWTAGQKWSQTFAFTILDDAAPMRIGTPGELMARCGCHPRAMVPAGGVQALRERLAEEKPGEVAFVRQDGEALLTEDHELAEPPFLPDARSHDYNTVHVVWRKAMQDTRAFAKGTERLAFAYLVTGDQRYAAAAAARLDSLAGWDPDGSTSIEHNDEPHMAVMDGAMLAFDWVADALDENSLARIAAHLGRRAENSYRWLLERRNYGIERFDSHSGRMLGFLGQSGISLAGHDQGAGERLRYVLELMVAMYPAWGLHEGGWGEGFSYCSAYVRWILQFLYSAKTALDLDFYLKPFFRSHARWWVLACPYYANQTPFGDGGDRRIGVPIGNAAVITGHLGKMTGDKAALEYSRRCRNRGAGKPDGHGVSTGNANLAFSPTDVEPLMLLPDATDPGAARRLPRAEAFYDIGYVAMRRDPSKVENDIALVFKSSPYGPMGHSHGDQNCFVLSAFGEPLLIRTGYYTGYSSSHHHNWVRQTKAHNGVTVSGAGQWVRNPDSVGRIAAFKRARRFAYCCGDAGSAYGARLDRFDRHVLFVDYRYFVIVDDLASAVETTFEFHLHAVEPFEVDSDARTARARRKGVSLDVRFVCPVDLRLYERSGFDPANDDPGFPDLPEQFHVRAATVPPRTRLRAAMVLIPQEESKAEPFTVELAPGERGMRVQHSNGADEFVLGADGEGAFRWARDGETLFEA